MAGPLTPASGPVRQSLAEGRTLAAAMPELSIEARRITATILAGWHGRRRAGPGETFWQFRQFVAGEPAAGIDWRRSARDDHHLFVREKEWEAAHTLWLSPDLSASMDFRSHLSRVTKRERAAVLTLALAELFARAGERTGLLGHTAPVLSRNAANKIAVAMAAAGDAAHETQPLRRHAEVILLGDFLDPIAAIEARLDAIAATGATVHLVQVLDPIEETFPYTGRTEFRDPESGARQLLGRAEGVRGAYQRLLAARRDRLAAGARRRGGSFLVHRTDEPATAPLLALYARLGDRGDLQRAAAGRAA
ncbi:MAG: DUF58 domain-containing protein [Bauldia sp.]|nr:DUF58 domain-containing protein [Bauldia sp.]